MKVIGAIAIAGACFFGGQAATAATVTVGAYSFDDSQFAQSATETIGSVNNLWRMVDGDLATLAAVGPGAEVRLDFGSAIVNGAGADLLVFECCDVEAPQISLTSLGTGLVGTLASTEPSRGGGAINIFAFDLDDLGVGAGQEIGASIFLRRQFSNPEIFGVAALNLRVSAVPLPATGLLLLGALGGLALRRRREG